MYAHNSFTSNLKNAYFVLLKHKKGEAASQKLEAKSNFIFVERIWFHDIFLHCRVPSSPWQYGQLSVPITHYTNFSQSKLYLNQYFKLCHYYYYLYMLDIHSTQLHTCHKLEMHHTQQNILNILVLSHDHCKNIVHYDHTSDQLIHPHHRHSLKQVMIFSKI